MLGKKIVDYFCFLPPPFLSPNLKIVIFFFQPPLLPPTLKIVWGHFYALNQIHPNSFAHNFMCELPMFDHLSSLFSAFFFSSTWFPFCLLSWTTSHSMPPQVQNHGLFLPIYCPLINLKYSSSYYYRTCRNAWHQMEFKVLLVYKRHCLQSPV